MTLRKKNNNNNKNLTMQIFRIKHELRKRARDEDTPLLTIFNEVMADMAGDLEKSRVPTCTFSNVKSAMYRSRSKRSACKEAYYCSEECMHLDNHDQFYCSEECMYLDNHDQI